MGKLYFWLYISLYIFTYVFQWETWMNGNLNIAPFYTYALFLLELTSFKLNKVSLSYTRVVQDLLILVAKWNSCQMKGNAQTIIMV